MLVITLLIIAYFGLPNFKAAVNSMLKKISMVALKSLKTLWEFSRPLLPIAILCCIAAYTPWKLVFNFLNNANVFGVIFLLGVATFCFCSYRNRAG